MIESMKIKKTTTIKVGDRILAAFGGPLAGYGMPREATITHLSVTDRPWEKESDDDRREVMGDLVLDGRVIFVARFDHNGESHWFYSDQVKEIIDTPCPSV
jgi:hypothetical protein